MTGIPFGVRVVVPSAVIVRVSVAHPAAVGCASDVVDLKSNLTWHIASKRINIISLLHFRKSN